MDCEVKTVHMDVEFKVCPGCRYKDAYHSKFKQEDEIKKWLFICPSCHTVFDIGLTVYSK